MKKEISSVLEFGAPEPGEAAKTMEDKLRFHTDSWDLAVDLKAALPDIVVIDARSRGAYTAGHIPGAISFPHRDMNAETVAQLDRKRCTLSIATGLAATHRLKECISWRDLGFALRSCSAGSIGGVATAIP